jgi:hypothetical protein
VVSRTPLIRSLEKKVLLLKRSKLSTLLRSYGLFLMPSLMTELKPLSLVLLSGHLRVPLVKLKRLSNKILSESSSPL